VLHGAIVLCAELRRVVFLKFAKAVARTPKPVQYAVRDGQRPGSMVESTRQRRTGRIQSAVGGLASLWGRNGEGFQDHHSVACDSMHTPHAARVGNTGTKNAGAH
jgi:hypothetical protein